MENTFDPRYMLIPAAVISSLFGVTALSGVTKASAMTRLLGLLSLVGWATFMTITSDAVSFDGYQSPECAKRILSNYFLGALRVANMVTVCDVTRWVLSLPSE